jgi:hypothetical protein
MLEADCIHSFTDIPTLGKWHNSIVIDLGMKDNRISSPHLVNPKAELSKQFDGKKAIVRKRRLSEHPLRSPVNRRCLAHASPRL